MESDLRGIAVGSPLVGQKKEKAFHMIYHEADSDSAEKPSASTDLYRRTVWGVVVKWRSVADCIY